MSADPIRSLIEAAVLAERRRCAAIARDYVRDAMETLDRTSAWLAPEMKGRIEAGEKIAEEIEAADRRNGDNE